MSDDPVRTQVKLSGSWLPFQEFMITAGGKHGAEIEGVELAGIDDARPSPEAIAAIERSDVIVIGPSNPVISIGPILAVPGMQEAIADCGAPVVAVSPFVGGRALKGPTEDFCRWAGLPLGSECVFQAYADLVHGAVADEPVAQMQVHVTQTLMNSAENRRRVAQETLDFAGTLGG
jgi:LPPG:FO 2-phospho-L-lactate transferase